MWNSVSLALLLALLVLTSGCRDEIMYTEPRLDIDAGSPLIASGQYKRVPPANTVAMSDPLDPGSPYYTGKEGDRYVDRLPVPLTRALLERGRERYQIFCSPCHGSTGYGDGMVARRGFPHPPSYHTDKEQDCPPGRIVETITRGHETMASYADRVPIEDRWAIAAYIKALQLSQHARLSDVPQAERQSLESAR